MNLLHEYGAPPQQPGQLSAVGLNMGGGDTHMVTDIHAVPRRLLHPRLAAGHDSMDSRGGWPIRSNPMGGEMVHLENHNASVTTRSSFIV